jgi:hypothetical protein
MHMATASGCRAGATAVAIMAATTSAVSVMPQIVLATGRDTSSVGVNRSATGGGYRYRVHLAKTVATID